MSTVDPAPAETTAPETRTTGPGWREIAVPLTEQALWSHSGVAVTHDGRIVVSTPGSGQLSMIDPNDVVVTLDCGDGVYHGMATDPDPSSSLIWLADIGVEAMAGGLRTFDLDSSTLAAVSPDSLETPSIVGWRPTAVAVERSAMHPEGPIVWLADGYGHSLVHRIEAGRITMTLDGLESGVRFDCPHGVALDTRGAHTLVVVADRSNQRLVWFGLDGTFVRELRNDLITSPSSIAVRGDRLIVTELFGSIIAVTDDDDVIDLVRRSSRNREGAWPNEGAAEAPVRPALTAGRVNSPHGIASTPHGVVVTEWLIGGRTIHLGDDIVLQPSFAQPESPILTDEKTRKKIE